MKTKCGFLTILIPGATVFISSGCIMIIELVASRLIARHLGSSLYTWTAVIGIVLAGITIGNYIGGRIADRFKAGKSLSVIFLFCSVSCVITIILNNIIDEWIWLWHLSWPAHIFIHVSLVFLLPSLLLGTISPVVAKMALERGLPQGRTVGDIYACGAAGSIAGTFLAGYFLIAAMGTAAIIWTIGGVLLFMSLVYWLRFVPAYLWAVVFIVLLLMGIAPYQSLRQSASHLGLREKPNPRVLYEDETQYCYIAVKRVSQQQDIRIFLQDKLTHSKILMDDITDLQYFYTHIYAAVTQGLSRNKKTLTTLTIGGGGYVYPRYIEKMWPGSRVDVAEIDPGVTRAAMEAFGLPADTAINTVQMDARNYIDNLLRRKNAGMEIPQYDFIYEDAINDFTVPFQLVTKEFNEKIAEILPDDGVYMVNLIDIYDVGLFLGSVVRTLEETFPYVYVVTEQLPAALASSTRVTYVVVASKRQLDLPDIVSGYDQQELGLWYLDEKDIDKLRRKNRSLVMTDDYAPVENLLADVVLVSAKDMMAGKYVARGLDLKEQEKYAQSIEYLQAAVKADKLIAVKTYTEIGLLYSVLGDLEKSARAFRNAIEADKELGGINDVGIIHFNLGIVLQRLDKPREAQIHFHKAVERFKEEFPQTPEYQAEAYEYLGNTYMTAGQFSDASQAFEKALSLNPYDMLNYTNLEKALEFQGRYEEEIEVIRRQIRFFENDLSPESIKQLEQYIEFLERKKANKSDNTF